MRKIKDINMNKNLIDNLLEEASIADYMLEGFEIASDNLPIVLKSAKDITEEEKMRIKKSTKRIAEINLILEILSSVGE